MHKKKDYIKAGMLENKTLWYSALIIGKLVLLIITKLEYGINNTYYTISAR